MDSPIRRHAPPGDPRALASRHAPDLHDGQAPPPEVRERHAADLQQALQGLDDTRRERFRREYDAALQAHAQERERLAGEADPAALPPPLRIRFWTTTGHLRRRSDELDRRARALVQREAATQVRGDARPAPSFSAGTLAVFEEKARIDLEIRRREARVLRGWQWTVLVLAVVSFVLIAWWRG